MIKAEPNGNRRKRRGQGEKSMVKNDEFNENVKGEKDEKCDLQVEILTKYFET